MGDIIFSATVLQFIHKHYPFAKITWVCDALFAPLFTQHPLLHTVHGVRLKQLKKERSFSLLRQEFLALKALGQFDMIIDLQSLLKSAIIGKILQGPLMGFHKQGCREPIASYFYAKQFAIDYKENVVIRAMELTSQALSFNYSKEELLHKSPLFFVDANTNYSDANIAIVIGASWPSKRYSSAKWIELIETLKEPVYIIHGNAQDKIEAQRIAEASKYASVAPSLELFELIAFIKQMQLVIGNDTGPTHLAWALNVASITLFGPTNERMIYPTDVNQFINSHSSVDIAHINKNDDSISSISTQSIALKAREILRSLPTQEGE